jgi:SAM-dependent methyltransferase
VPLRPIRTVFEYQTLFDAHGPLYNEANRRHPRARSEEARRLFDHLELSPAAHWLDLCAGGGYLSERAVAEGLPPASASCDGSLTFVQAADGPVCVARPDSVPFPDRSFSGAACLAALHHAEDPEALVAELVRVVAPGGRVALGDAAAESAASVFLNGFVHANTREGHRGRFHSPEALAAFFARAGGRDVRREVVRIGWVFERGTDAIEFARSLFGLLPETREEPIRNALASLGAPLGAAPARVPWDMVFVSAARA